MSDKQKRTMLLLSVCDTAFVICFLIELWYTRRVLFYVEVSVLTCAALSSAAGQQKRAKFPTSKAPLSAVFHENACTGQTYASMSDDRTYWGTRLSR